MLAERIKSLEKAIEEGSGELKPELEALKAISEGIVQKKLPLGEFKQLSLESFSTVLSELVRQKDPELVLSLRQVPLDKARQKLLKKAQHQLKSQGVQIPEPEVLKKITFPPQIHKEWAKITPVIVISGGQILYYFASGTMGTNLMICHLHLEDGVKNLAFVAPTENQAKKLIAETKIDAKISVPVIDIPKEHFLWLIHNFEGKTKNPEVKTNLRTFLEKFRLLTSTPSDSEHPALKLFDRDQIQARPSLSSWIDRLLEHPFFYFWEFEQEIISACSEEIREVEESLILIKESQKLDRIEGIFEKYAEEGLRKNLDRLRFGLLENAYLLSQKEEMDLAEVALKLALNLENKYESGEFFKKILLRSFPAAEKALAKKTTSLIIPGR